MKRLPSLSAGALALALVFAALPTTAQATVPDAPSVSTSSVNAPTYTGDKTPASGARLSPSKIDAAGGDPAVLKSPRPSWPRSKLQPVPWQSPARKPWLYWAASDFSDSGLVVSLRCRGRLLITIMDFIRPPVIECRMAPATVIETLDVADDVTTGTPLCGVRRTANALVFQG